MNNVIAENYYSNTFVCDWEFIKDIPDLDSIFDIITFHLSPKLGEKFNFYLSLNDLIVTSPNNLTVSTLLQPFSNIQNDLSKFIKTPVKVSTGEIPKDGLYWEVRVRHGAIESSRKLS